MTAERKAEVNGRLAEFEGWTWHPGEAGFGLWYKEKKQTSSCPPDYTADLNALTQLVKKTPFHDSRWPLDAELIAERICQYLERKDA